MIGTGLNLGTGSSIVAKFLTLLSSPVTGVVDAFSAALSQNGDPVLAAQSFGNTVIDATEATIAGFVGTMAMAAGVGDSWVAELTTKTGIDFSRAIQIASTYLAPFLLVLSLALLGFGALLAYILPALPFVVWTLEVIAWLVLVLEALVAVPVWGILHASPEGEGFLPGTVRNGYLLLLNLFAQPALMTIGFFAGFFVLAALALLSDQGFSVMVAGITAGNLTGIVGFVALLGVLAGLLTTAAWKAFHLVVWFPDHVLRWIGSSGSPMGMEGWRDGGGEPKYPWNRRGGSGKPSDRCRERNGEDQQDCWGSIRKIPCRSPSSWGCAGAGTGEERRVMFCSELLSGTHPEWHCSSFPGDLRYLGRKV